MSDSNHTCIHHNDVERAAVQDRCPVCMAHDLEEARKLIDEARQLGDDKAALRVECFVGHLQNLIEYVDGMAALKSEQAADPHTAFPDLYADPKTLAAAHGVAAFAAAEAYTKVAGKLKSIMDKFKAGAMT